MASTDSEDDGEFIPDPLSDSSEDEQSVHEHTASPKPTEQDESARKKARDVLWAEFQASVAAPPQSVPEQPPKKLVKVVKRYRFAGEDVVDVVEVPEDSPDAKKWPPWQQPQPSSSSSSPPPSTTATATTPLPKPRPPGPRKPKTSLTALPTPSSQKAKKLSTLDKSAMDWRAHLDSQQDSTLKHELEANRRGGGYLEKMEFLKRVEERKEDALDAVKSRKRRKL